MNTYTNWKLKEQISEQQKIADEIKLESTEIFSVEDESKIDESVLLFESENMTIRDLESQLTNEGIFGSILGGLSGAVLGKAVGKIVAKALGVERGILYDLLTSRLVGAALGASLGKKL